MKKIIRRSDCPISFSLDFFGDKWSFLILRDMIFADKCSYGEFLNSEEKIATNILADRLSMLEHAKIITKKPSPEHGSKIIYSLTEKGIDLVPVLIAMIFWGAKYDPKTAAPKEFIDRIKNDRESLIKDITAKLKASKK